MMPVEYKKMYQISWTYEGASFWVQVEGYFANRVDLVGQKRLDGVHAAMSWLLEDLKRSGKPKDAPIPSLRLASDRPAIPPLRTAADAPDTGSYTMTTKSGEVKRIAKSTVTTVFGGKGSPSEIKEVLWAATHVGQIVTDPAKTGDRAALPQNYVDMYIGVDCSGFVMNYLNPNVTSTIEKLDHDHEKERRKTLQDIQAADVMCFYDVSEKDYHHIALVSSFNSQCEEVKIDHVGKTPVRTVYTVESNGGKVYSSRMQRKTMQGVSNHYYVITPKPKEPGVFLEVRGKTLMKGQEFYFHPAEFRRTPKL